MYLLVSRWPSLGTVRVHALPPSPQKNIAISKSSTISEKVRPPPPKKTKQNIAISKISKTSKIFATMGEGGEVGG